MCEVPPTVQFETTWLFEFAKEHEPTQCFMLLRRLDVANAASKVMIDTNFNMTVNVNGIHCGADGEL